MKNFKQWLEGLTIKLAIALAVATGGVVLLQSIRLEQARNELTDLFAEAQKEGISPEMLFAHQDGKNRNQQEEVAPYAKALDQLEKKCREPRTELATMAVAVMKREKKQDSQVTYLDGLELLQAMVESDSKPRQINCMPVYNQYIKNSRTSSR